MSEKACVRCGRPVHDDSTICGPEDSDLCMECWLREECICPDGRFKIYLPDYSVKIVDLEEYEAVREIFGDKIFIIITLDHDPRRVARRSKNKK
ncbi:MAG: hypothetical protein ACE5NJ_06610 [Thermodesulfobacteriota bacterium]